MPPGDKIWRIGGLIGLLVLGDCSGLSGDEGQAWRYDCKGKMVLTVVGGAAAFSGVNGTLTADCADGAYISKTPVVVPAATTTK